MLLRNIERIIQIMRSEGHTLLLLDATESYYKEIANSSGEVPLSSQAAGGCCGPSVQLSLDKPMETDLVSTINGLQVSIDSEVFEVSRVLTLDFVQDGQGEGLVISGENSTGYC